MSAQHKLSWQSDDLEPGWLSLTPAHQRANLLELLRHAPRSKGELAHQMLVAPPWPSDQTDAKARAAAVIEYLMDGYRVGDRHPSTELTEAG